jgi:hypothetical protein
MWLITYFVDLRLFLHVYFFALPKWSCTSQTRGSKLPLICHVNFTKKVTCTHWKTLQTLVYMTMSKSKKIAFSCISFHFTSTIHKSYRISLLGLCQFLTCHQPPGPSTSGTDDNHFEWKVPSKCHSIISCCNIIYCNKIMTVGLLFFPMSKAIYPFTLVLIVFFCLLTMIHKALFVDK